MLFTNDLSYIICFIQLFLIYGFLTIAANMVAAWIYKKLGDTTAEQEGFLTVNPVVHLDLFNAMLFMIFRVVTLPVLPFNPHNIHEPHKKAKLFIAHWVYVIAYFFVAWCCMILLVVLSNGKVSLGNVSPMIQSLSIPCVEGALAVVGRMIGVSVLLLLLSAIFTVLYDLARMVNPDGPSTEQEFWIERIVMFIIALGILSLAGTIMFITVVQALAFTASPITWFIDLLFNKGLVW